MSTSFSRLFGPTTGVSVLLDLVTVDVFSHRCPGRTVTESGIFTEEEVNTDRLKYFK